MEGTSDYTMLLPMMTVTYLVPAWWVGHLQECPCPVGVLCSRWRLPPGEERGPCWMEWVAAQVLLHSQKHLYLLLQLLSCLDPCESGERRDSFTLGGLGRTQSMAWIIITPCICVSIWQLWGTSTTCHLRTSHTLTPHEYSTTWYCD